MRGYVEEGPDAVARRKLRDAARRYTATYLLHYGTHADAEKAEKDLDQAAVDYAAAITEAES